jgi:hypothetical protein
MIRFLMMLFQMFSIGKEEPKTAPASIPQPKIDSTPSSKTGVDWTDPNCPISKYFTVKNAIYLPQWSRLSNERDSLTDDAKAALIKLFTEIMDPIRELLGKPIKVHVSFRSPEYNVLIGGAKMSIHMARKHDDGSLVAACDFSADMGKGSLGANCYEIKKILKPKLAEMGIRMEDNGDLAPWVHIDNRKPGPGGRFFKP